MSKIKASDYIAEFLRVQKTTHIFEVAGGMITHILDSLYRLGNTNIISVHHEQAAAFAAEAYGRRTGRPGIALATSGPGATNLLTGIASCYFDSSPALFITGQVNTHEQKRARPIRQLGFQETDIVSMAQPITKKCFLVEEPEQLESIFETAYHLAMNGRPGPVLIDIPMNIQNAMIETKPIQYIDKKYPETQISTETMETLYRAMQRSRRPLILAGQGISCAQAVKEFIQFVELTQIPVVTSLLGLDIIPYHHTLRAGFIGSYGNRWSNLTIADADLLINIGSRLDIRQTGADVQGFCKNKTIFHIDCDEHEINNRVKNCFPIVSDAKNFLHCANDIFKDKPFSKPISWINKINQLRIDWPDIKELQDFQGINPNSFMHHLAIATQNTLGYVVDVGSHQMWAAQSLELSAEQAFITSGGMGAMGFALPAAIGYCLAADKKPITVIVGDGAVQINIQELQTIVRNSLPIKIIVMNNQSLGMIRQFQDSYFSGRYQSTYWGYTAPNFVALAEAYGIKAKSISSIHEIETGLSWLQHENQQPILLEVMINPRMNVYPKIAFGRPISEMEPIAAPIAMEST